ncbi:MAG: DUF2207 domain-containing protein [Xanthobacteraceae bacterium]
MRLLTFFLLAALAIAGAKGALAEEIIHRFDAVVRVAQDGKLHVTETIRVRAEGAEIKRGIYRDFPLTFEDSGGRVREVTFKLLEVTRDGQHEPFFTRREGESIRIYAGKEDVFLRRGDYTYTFSYETGRQIRWFDGVAELYWNVTGNAWSFPILSATVRVELPGSARPSRWTAYTGPFGARGTEWRGSVNSGGALVAETTQRLGRREGFTVVVQVPEGAVQRPTPAQELWYSILDNRGWVFGGLGFALVLGYYGFAWNAVGRDPKSGTIIPLFHPPKGVSPALASYVRNWGFSGNAWRAFTAAALSLAVRGLLLFDERDGDLTLKTTARGASDSADSLPPGERAILHWVRGQGGSATINSENGAKVATVGKNFQDSIEGESRDRFFRKNLGYVFAGLGLTTLVVTGIVIFGGLREADYFVLFAIGFVGIFAGAFLVPLLRGLLGADSSGATLRSALTLIAVLVFFVFVGSNFLSAVPNGFGGVLSFVRSTLAEHPFPLALVTGFAALNGLFLYLLRAPTDLGRPVMDQLDGFRLYLTTAETPRLNMNVPEITAERFEALLPYAVALDAEEPWSGAFAAALRRAYPDDTDPMSHYQPRWRSGGAWSSSNFSRSISSSVAGATSAFASAVPRSSSGSSGFSSGGGSGGGGGGGGGGGW